MKRIDLFVCMALGVMLAAGCEKEEKVIDFPVVGDLSISGKYVTYMHGLQGWVEEDKIGVFVTSDGVEQANLVYKPSEVCPTIPNKFMEGFFDYDRDNYKDGDILLKAEGTAAGFKQGEHNIYAYVPYSAGNETYSTVKLPNTSIQEELPWIGLNYIKFDYMFAYAKLAEPVSEYSSATLSLGEFKSPFVQMSLTSPEFPESFDGKKVTKIIVSADKDIAVKNATINLATGEISGEMSKSIEYVLAEDLVLAKGYLGVGWTGMQKPLSICLGYEEGMDTEFTFTFTIDGKEYITKGKPAAAPYSSEGNLNMNGQLTITE